jgi:hypothetical protein
MSDNAYASDQITEPSDAMVALDRLVGTWTVTGGAEGTVRYEWMPGQFLCFSTSSSPSTGSG